MFTVGLIGPDGAGKTTVSRLLAAELDLPMSSIYMGVNLESSTIMLPTTRLVLAIRRARGLKPDMVASTDRGARKPQPRGAKSRGAAGLKSGLRLVVWLAEEWFRQLFAWYLAKVRGRIVVFDRHFFADYYHHDIADMNGRRPLANRVHGFVLQHLYPKPDLLICLDAPAEVLYERKPEASVAWLAQRRQEYMGMRDVVPHFACVDATRPLEDVTREVATLITSFHEAKIGVREPDGGHPSA